MNIFDSNVWIAGLTQTNDRCEELVCRCTPDHDDPIHVSVSPYIYQEVFDNLAKSRVASDADVEQLQTYFATIIAKSIYIDGPDTETVDRISVEGVRQRPETQILSSQLGIELKDVPIVVHAAAWNHRDPTLYTTDKPFYENFPTGDAFDSVTVVHIER